MTDTATDNLKKGEVVIFINDYDVFGYNAKGKEGMFYREAADGRYLVYLPEIKEWCEPQSTQLERKRPGFIPVRFVRFCKNVETLRVQDED